MLRRAPSALPARIDLEMRTSSAVQSRLHLRLLGSPSLVRDGEALEGSALPRGEFAVLAVLAAVGEQGIPRDALAALFAGEEGWDGRSGHLDGVLGRLRSAVGDDTVVDGEIVRLNPAAVSSDLEELHALIRAGETARAGERYTARFLEDFRLPDAPAFEEWRLQEGERIARAVAHALEPREDGGRER